MDLFTVENGNVKPTYHSFLLKPFSEIWKRDNSERKDKAMSDFIFIEFTGSLKKSNPFSGYNDNERKNKVIEYLSKQEEYIPDKLTLEGLEVYIKFRNEASPTASFYESALIGAKKTETFFRDFDLTERTNSGTMVLKPGDVTRALKDSQQVLQSLSALKDKVQQELFEASKTRNKKEINHFEQ